MTITLAKNNVGNTQSDEDPEKQALFYWPHLTACGILVPDQGLNPGTQQ